MSDKIDDGRRAFPNNMDGDLYDGMTMRQWYKGQAMKALVANPSTYLVLTNDGDRPGAVELTDMIVHRAGKIADAMIAEDKRGRG